MAQSKKLENLIKQKNNLTDSIELCCNSISFWEKRANKIFTQMDSFEDEIKFCSEAESQKKYKFLNKESERLMARINFENNQLDILEQKILNLEEAIIKALDSYAKKQKK